jgi:exopolysaccharide production protein ExoQ
VLRLPSVTREASLRPLRDALLIALVGLVAGGLNARGMAYGLAAIAPVLLILAWQARRHPIDAHVPRRYAWVPLAWVALLIISDFKLSPARSPLAAASSNLSLDNIIELGVYAAVGVGVLSALYSWVGRREPIPALLLTAWPAFAVVSAAWSIIPVFSLIRAVQLFVPIGLSVLTARLWRLDPGIGQAVFRRSLRFFIQFTSVMAVAGFMFRGQWLGNRFMWPWAQHPVAASSILGLALLILLAGGPAFAGFSRPAFLLRVALFGTGLILGQTRGVLAALALGSLLALWLGGRKQILARYLAVPLVIGAGVFGFLLAHASVIAYLSRGQTADTFTSLNGRIPLWHLAFSAMNGRWMTGFGYGAARVILFQKVDWAGEAHSAWIELLLGTGAIGLVLGVLGLLYLGVRLFRQVGRHFSIEQRVATCVFSYIVILSTIQAELVLPGFMFAAYTLLFAFALGTGTGSHLPLRPHPMEERVRVPHR